MASRANQQSGGSGSTSKPKVKAPKKPAGHAPTKADAQHAGYTPAPVDPLLASAQQQAASIYAPQVNANASLQASVPGWYADYQTRAAAQQAAAQAYAAPVIKQAQDFATNVATPAAGLDPNSAEYARSQQAGTGLGALAQLGAQNLQANQLATTDYFGGQAQVAARYLPQAMVNLRQEGGRLASQQAGKAQELYQGAKTTAVNQDIAYKTLGVNAANTLADNTRADQTAAQTASDRKAARVVSRKNTRDRLAATQTNQATAQAKADAKQAERDAAAAAKKTATIQKAIGKAKNKVQDIKDEWAKGKTAEYTVTVDAKTGLPAPKGFTGKTKTVKKTRPASRDELRGALQAKYGTQWVSIMERVRAGQAITPQQVDYLHNQDPDFRVPKEWKTGRKKDTGSGTGNPASAPYTGLG